MRFRHNLRQSSATPIKLIDYGVVWIRHVVLPQDITDMLPKNRLLSEVRARFFLKVRCSSNK